MVLVKLGKSSQESIRYAYWFDVHSKEIDDIAGPTNKKETYLETIGKITNLNEITFNFSYSDYSGVSQSRFLVFGGLVIDSFDDFLKQTKIRINSIKNKEEFIKKIRSVTSKKLEGYILIYFDERNERFLFFRDYFYQNSFSFLFAYTPEKKSYIEILKNVFNFTMNLEDDLKNIRIVSSNTSNNFNIAAPWQMYELLFAKADVADENEELYTVFYKKKKSGKLREIVAPNPKILLPLRHINYILQKVYDKRNENFQIAYKKDKNIKSGAKLHVNHKYVFNMDLKDFFPSCTIEKIKPIMNFFFNSSANREYLEKEFYECTTKDNHLFIGSPVSGTIANAITSNSFNYLNNMCRKYGMSLSVFADDITFSSNKFINVDFISGMIEEAFRAYNLDTNFRINDKKSVGFSGCNRKVTGVSINENDKITISQKYFKQIRAGIHHLSLGDIDVDVNKLRGKIAYATMLDDSGKLYRYLEKFESTIKEFSLCSEETMEKLKKRIGENK